MWYYKNNNVVSRIYVELYIKTEINIIIFYKYNNILIKYYSDCDDIFIASTSLLCSSWLRRVSENLTFVLYNFCRNHFLFTNDLGISKNY